MDKLKHRLKEPGLGRLLLSVFTLGSAILIGFMLGIMVGDRNRRSPEPKPVSLFSSPVPAIPDTLAAPEPDSLSGAGFPAEALETESPSDSLVFSKKEITSGVEYLATHNRWNRDEMEKIPVLAGLWDAVNTYALDEIKTRNDILSSTPLTSIVESLEQNPKKGYYAPKGDNVITLSTYFKHLR